MRWYISIYQMLIILYYFSVIFKDQSFSIDHHVYSFVCRPLMFWPLKKRKNNFTENLYTYVSIFFYINHLFYTDLRKMLSLYRIDILVILQCSFYHWSTPTCCVLILWTVCPCLRSELWCCLYIKFVLFCRIS